MLQMLADRYCGVLIFYISPRRPPPSSSLNHQRRDTHRTERRTQKRHTHTQITHVQKGHTQKRHTHTEETRTEETHTHQRDTHRKRHTLCSAVVASARSVVFRSKHTLLEGLAVLLSAAVGGGRLLSPLVARPSVALRFAANSFS